MVRIKKKIITIVIILIIAAIVVSVLYYIQGMPIEVDTYLVELKTAELSFTEEGSVASRKAFDVYPLVNGEILEVLTEENSEIVQGEVICRINPVNFENQIRQLESGINSYKAQIENLSFEENKTREDLLRDRDALTAEIKVLETQKSRSVFVTSENQRVSNEQVRLQEMVIKQNEKYVEIARDYMEKAELLYDADAVTRAEYNDSKNSYDNAVANLEKSKQEIALIVKVDQTSDSKYYNAMINALNVQINGINKRLESENISSMVKYYNSLIDSDMLNIEFLQENIEQCTIRAPISGVITSLPANKSNIVLGGNSIASISTTSENCVEVMVYTDDIDNVNIGQQVELILKRTDDDKVLSGYVTSVDNLAVLRVSSNNSEDRLVKVTVTPDFPEEFKIGYNVDVRFCYFREENQILVPRRALFKENDQDMVWVVTDGILEKVEVQVGRYLQQEALITSGLSEGSEIVTDSAISGLKIGGGVS